MKSIYKSLLKKALLVTLIVHLSVFSFAATYYVSKSGNDGNSGLTTSTPWKSLEKVNSFAFKPGDQILFNRGDSFYGSLIINDMGASGNPITFGAYGTGANPIITGFTDVTSWTNLGSNIWESTSVVSALSDCKMVTINGAVVPMGRYPNYNSTDGGFLAFQSHTTTSITSSSLSGTPNWTGAEVIFRSRRYILSKKVIASQSGSTLSWSGDVGIDSDGYGFFIQNDVRTLDQQNEWHFNPTTKKIRIYSTSQPINVKVASIENLVAFDKLSYNYSLAAHIKIENIDFVGSNGNLVHSYPALVVGHRLHHVNISNCNLAFAGYNAIIANGDYMTIENNTMSDVNGSGIYCNYGKGIHSVKNNTLTNISMVYGQGNPSYGDIAISYSRAKSATIEANKIINCGFNGISFDADSSMVLKNNYIQNFNLRLDDGGAITTGNNNSFGTKIDGNICINGGYGNAVKGTTDTGGGLVVGIYLDDNSANIEVSNNTISECSWVGIYLHNSNTNNVHHNTVFDCGYTQIRTADDALGGDIYANIIQNNLFVAKESTQLCAAFNSNQNNLTTIGTMNGNIYARPIDDNITISTYQPSTGSVNRTLAGWQTFSKQDLVSNKSPQLLTNLGLMQFEYNETKSIKTISLVQPMIDMKGTKYSKSITLQPFTSVVLMKDNNPVILPPVYNTEYVSICDGGNYNGWTITGKYSRTLVAESGADSIVTTYLTVNTKYTVTEDITINEGESYQKWTVSGSYKRILSSVSGCDSAVITNLTVLENSGKLGMIQPTHFIPVWQGETGYNLMNFVVNSATLADLPLQADDEIGVFSQGVCVGSVRLTQTISATDQSTYLSFVASQNTGSNNGYTLGETVVFKIWDNSNQTEWTVNKVTYQAGSAPVITSGLFTPQATAIASLESYQVFTQTVSFKKGNNLFSTYLIPENADVATVMEPLCKSGALYKMQDEAGRSFEYWGSYGGWVNKIGNIASTEGYNVNVNFDCTLQITGRQKVALALTIPLKKGWNFISFPRQDMINAMTVVQPLIDQKKLGKVQDESGNSIENLKGYGWVNNIGNFVPGKAYKVYATSAASLVIQPGYTKSVLMMAEPMATEFFKPVYEGNGVNHMNINLVDLALLNAQAGDEIAAFDGELCVGALKLSVDNLNAGFAAIVASYTTRENTRDGFTDGNPVSLVLFKSGSGEKVELTNLSVIDGQTLFARNSSVLLGGQQLTTGNELTLGNNETNVLLFPNPCKGNFSVRIQTGSSWADGKIEIFDFTGKLIESRIITENTETFSLNNRPSGMYFVKTTSGLMQHTDKLVVNN